MSEGFPGLPASDGMPRQKNRGWGREIRAALIILAGLWIGWHVLPALAVKDSPPIACQLDGGYWNIWNGWTCR